MNNSSVIGKILITGELTLKSPLLIGDGAGDFYANSFARLWGENISVADGWIKLVDAPRKLSMEIPCDDGDKKFYGLTTRNYTE